MLRCYRVKVEVFDVRKNMLQALGYLGQYSKNTKYLIIRTSNVKLNDKQL